MKKALAILVILVLAIGLVACNNGGNSPTGSPSSDNPSADPNGGGSAGETKDSYSFGFIFTSTGYFWDGVGIGANAKAEEIAARDGVTIDVEAIGPAQGGSISEQIQIFENMVQKGYDGIAIASIDPAALMPVINDAVSKGIVVITFDTDVPDSERLAFVGSDNYEFGCVMAETAAELMGGSGTVIIENGLPTQLGMVQRLAGVQDTFDADYPDIEIIDVQTHGGDTGKATADVETMTTMHPDFDMLLYLDAGGEYAVNVWRANGWTAEDKMAVLSDDLNAVVVAVKEQVVNATIVQGQYNWGFTGLEVMYDNIVNGVEPEDFVNTGVYAVDQARALEDYADVTV